MTKLPPALASGGLCGRVASRLESLWPIHGDERARGEMAGARDAHSCRASSCAPADEPCALAKVFADHATDWDFATTGFICAAACCTCRGNASKADSRLKTGYERDGTLARNAVAPVWSVVIPTRWNAHRRNAHPSRPIAPKALYPIGATMTGSSDPVNVGLSM